MRVSEKSLELNVGAELLSVLRDECGYPKSYLRGLTQAEEQREGVDFFAHLGSSARIFAFQFKAPLTGREMEPYRFTIGRKQHEALWPLASMAPGSVFYVLPFIETRGKLATSVPRLRDHTYLLSVADMPVATTFGPHKTRTVRCEGGVARVNPEYRLTSLAQWAAGTGAGVPVASFRNWYARSNATTLGARWLQRRGLRVVAVTPE